MVIEQNQFIEKKKNPFMLIIFLLIILLIGGAILAIVYKDEILKYFNPEDEETEIEEPQGTYLLGAKTEDGKDIEIDVFYGYYDGKEVIKIGNQKIEAGVKTTFHTPLNVSTIFHGYKEGYLPYQHNFGGQSKIGMVTREDFLMRKSGELNISHQGEINSGKNIINLEIESNGWFEYPAICLQWSLGIVDVNLPEQKSYCPNGWINYSLKYNVTEGTLFKKNVTKYRYLSDGFKRCVISEDEVYEAQCKVSDENIKFCNLGEIEPPERFQLSADVCYLGAWNLVKQKVKTQLEYRANNLECGDYIKFWIFDAERIIGGNPVLNTYEEYGDAGLAYGAKDFEYRINRC